jgi:uncharacterized protein YgiM (DUF1202 family)
VTIVANGRVLVRSLPGQAGNILGFVNNGDVYTLLEQSADGAWFKIDFRRHRRLDQRQPGADQRVNPTSQRRAK